WLDLSDVVDLEDAELIKASALTEELHRQDVHDCYDHFQQDGQAKHLTAALQFIKQSKEAKE
ncbi:MAG: hypothetical protein KDK78_03945, partial [Chlamydiia bacterium]|nr:hypothetical protein [Chlamydiia bacterium]